MSQTNRVFISYSAQDKAIAENINKSLLKSNVSTWIDYKELNTGESFSSKLNKSIKSCDFMIVLISKNSINSKWVMEETNLAFLYNTTIIPVKIESCEMPFFLKGYQYIDLSKKDYNNLDTLISELSEAPFIDFSALNALKFEHLVIDLLKKLKFINIVPEPNLKIKSNQPVSEPDISAIYNTNDPFGNPIEQTYLIEIKFYKKSRPDLKSLFQLAENLRILPDCVGLLVTNSKLTSASIEWLNDYKQKTGITIKIVDGAELQRQLIRFPDLIKRYFYSGGLHE